MLIKNATLLCEGRLYANMCLRWENGRIAEIFETGACPPDAQALDARGATVCAGFIDIHIHGYGGHDTMNGLEDVRAMARALPAHGVTAFLPTTMCASVRDTHVTVSAVCRAMEDDAPAARVLGVHMEGPFINPKNCGAQPPQFVFAPSRALYEEMTRGAERCVRLMTLSPEIEGAQALIDLLRGRVALSAGHTSATCEQMRAAIGRGVSQATHLFNAMSPLTHRAPGVPGAALTDSRVRVQLIADLLHLDKTVLALCGALKGADGCILITDAMSATGMSDGQYMLGASKVYVKNGEARLAEGNLAGSTLTMERAVRNMARVAGVGDAQALLMATRTPARAIGEWARGDLVPGMIADIVMLDGDFNVLRTWVEGREAYRAAR